VKAPEWDTHALPSVDNRSFYSKLTFNVSVDVPAVVLHTNTRMVVGEIEMASPYEFVGEHLAIEIQASHEELRMLERATLCRNGGDTDKGLELVTFDVSTHSFRYEPC
jgi:hypothetical protein